MSFELGQSVCISRRSCAHLDYDYRHMFKPWREGTVTAIGDKAVRVRTSTRKPWGKVVWVHLDHPLWQVTAINE